MHFEGTGEGVVCPIGEARALASADARKPPGQTTAYPWSPTIQPNARGFGARGPVAASAAADQRRAMGSGGATATPIKVPAFVIVYARPA